MIRYPFIRVLFLAAAVPLVAAQARAQSCNLIRNGDFASGLNVSGDGSMPQSSVADWSLASGTPQLTTQDGCLSRGYVRMWGNKTVGEAIQQKLAAPLIPGHVYKLTACVAWINNNPALPRYVRFRVRLSTGPLASYTTPGVLMGILGDPTNSPSVAAPGITSTQWTTVSLANFIAPPGSSLDTITINPENDNTAPDGGTVSWGEIDDVCLQDIRQACPPLDSGFNLTASLASGNSTTFQATATMPAQPPGAKFWWSVEEIDAAGNPVPGTKVSNPSAWWPNPLTNNFAGYNGTSTLGNTSIPGSFKQGHRYRIARGVWDICHPFTATSHTVFLATP